MARYPSYLVRFMLPTVCSTTDSLKDAVQRATLRARQADAQVGGAGKPVLRCACCAKQTAGLLVLMQRLVAARGWWVTIDHMCTALTVLLALLLSLLQDLPAVVHQLLMLSTRGCRELILQVGQGMCLYDASQRAHSQWL